MDVAVTAEHTEDVADRVDDTQGAETNGSDQTEENKFQKAIAAWRSES